MWRGWLNNLSEQLVAETCGDGNLVATLCAATIEDILTGLGLHPGKKTVRLGAVTTIGLEGALWHGTTISCWEGSVAPSS